MTGADFVTEPQLEHQVVLGIGFEHDLLSSPFEEQPAAEPAIGYSAFDLISSLAP